MAPGVKAIIVDNASTDGTLEQVRAWSQGRGNVRLVANPTNRGFAAAANQAVREADDARFLLLLNPDVCLLTGLDVLVSASRQYGIAAGKLVDQQSHTQAGFTVRRLPTPASLILETLGINWLWPGNPVNRMYRELDRDLNQAGAAEQPAGAFLMFRRDVWENLGGFDEQFFPVWFEDVDFCRRAVNAGHAIRYEPEAVASHKGGHSVGKIPAGRRTAYWCASLLKYAGKHFRPWAFKGICAAVVLGSVPRMAAAVISERSLSPLNGYLRTMRFAGICLLLPGHIVREYVKKGTGIS